MDWKVFSATFITIFLAEIGDKTQFAAMAISSQTNSTFSVLFATALALFAAAAIGVIIGTVLGKALDPQKIKYVSGSLFIIVGTWILFKK